MLNEEQRRVAIARLIPRRIRRVILDTPSSNTRDSASTNQRKSILINTIRLAIRPLHRLRPHMREANMELVFTIVAVIGGMTFSLAVAILVEELIFGKVLGVFFAPRAPRLKTSIQR
jgi:hypothetical protein